MKNLFQGLLLVFVLTCISCKKTDNNNSSAKLELLQHKWTLISRNGEVLRYVGTGNDYYNFSVDSILYRYVENIYDTSNYKLSPADNNILLLYPIKNGIQSSTATNYNINELTCSQLVVEFGKISPPVNVIDSLQR